ncbi:MAG: putative DNA binding domain-containing protein [Propionibacteriaceae bacterium]|jgi:ATP-dependent DNA helicase RecG|nr:putative DNA binding domain-containing protein [Propionibacteriaceae bacterium]
MDFETHNVEWKSSWRDEYLKWICGFANAQGGVLEIGRSDNGTVVGVSDARQLLTEIPNKVNSGMGILVDVDLATDDGLQYLVITVRPYPNPISYHGKYYVRSGATNRELTGNALDEFMLRKEGRTWDSVPVPGVGVDDLYGEAFWEFRQKALSSKRLTEADLDISDAALIDSLRLGEGRYLTRAAILLFHRDPEKWVRGASVRIGYFETGADLLFQDELHGPLITLADRVLDLIYTKYFRAYITYEGIQRVENFPVPQAAMREAVLNAIVHRDYSTGVPIQIKVFPHEVIIYNDGGLPDDWTVDDLLGQHRSQPRNPGIAGAFFRSGQIETWGRGIVKIEEACRADNKPLPVFRVKSREVSAAFPVRVGEPPASTTGVDDAGRVEYHIEQVDEQVDEQVLSMLLIARTPVPRASLLAAAGLADAYLNYRNHVVPLLDRGLLVRTIPDKPRAKTQRYVLTELGRAVIGNAKA